jgi:type IV pilus assembly protein PilC
MASQAKRALIYPSIVLVVVVGVIFVLMIFLVPQLAGTFKTLVPKLPRETELLIGLSNIFVKWWWALLGVPALLGAGLFALSRTNENVQRQLDVLAIRAPVIGAIRFKIMLARFTTFFAMLYRSGISVLDCIQICEKIMGNRTMEEALQRVGRQISDGTGISQAFSQTKLFPPLVLRMLRVGESTGGLDTALLNVSYFYNREVREGINKMQQLIGPATTMVLGLLIVAILYTIFLPLYDVISKIKF